VDLTICNQSSHGFGFCEYSSSAEADKAISALNGRKLLGLTLLVQRAKGRRQDQRRGLAIGGISAQELDETKLDNKIIKLRQALDKKTYKR
jgi:RNA recognition motif-containing protein